MEVAFLKFVGFFLEFGSKFTIWMHIIVCVCMQRVSAIISMCEYLHMHWWCVGSFSVYKCVSACAYICVWECVYACVCVCVQLSQVCVINQLSGQFICWVTSCNFPPDSRPFCQVGIMLRAHDKTLHLSAPFSRFFSLPLDFANCLFLSFSPLFPPLILASLPLLTTSHFFISICFSLSFPRLISLHLRPPLFHLLYLFLLPSTTPSSGLGVKKADCIINHTAWSN